MQTSPQVPGVVGLGVVVVVVVVVVVGSVDLVLVLCVVVVGLVGHPVNAVVGLNGKLFHLVCFKYILSEAFCHSIYGSSAGVQVSHLLFISLV